MAAALDRATQLALLDVPAPDIPRREAAARSLLRGPAVRRVITLLRGLNIPGLSPWEPSSQGHLRADLQSRGWPSNRSVQQIPDTVDEVAEHILSAASLDHPSSFRAGAVHPDVDAANRWIAALGPRHDMVAERGRRCAVLATAARQLAPIEEALDALRPASIARLPRRANSALVYACLEAAGAPDSEALALGYVVGFECVGEIPESGWWTPDERPADLDFTVTNHDAWVNDLEASCRREWAQGRTRADCEVVYARTLEEVGCGLMHGPYTRADLDAAHGRGNWRPMRRFGVWQKGKCRGCDNARASGSNRATSFHERMLCEGADFPARAAASAAHAHGRPVAMEGGTEDLPDAYRYCPARDPRYTVVCTIDPQGKIAYFTMGGFNFGLSSAVPQFNRLPEGAQLCARRLLGVCCCHYFDDFDTTEPTYCDGSGQTSLSFLLDAWGYPFAERKSVPPALVHVFLGVESDLRSTATTGCVYLRVPRDRVSLLRSRLGDVLARGELRSSESSSLAGSLGFTLLWGFCRFGRAAMQPLYERSRRSDHDCRLTPGERSSLEFYYSIIDQLRPCRYDLSRARVPPVLVWSDASWEADDADLRGRSTSSSLERPRGVGFVVAVPRGSVPLARERFSDARVARRVLGTCYDWYHCSCEPPLSLLRLFRDRRTQIGQMELLAAVLPYYTLPRLFVDREVLHWIDNTGAVCACVKGYTRAPDSVRIVHALHALLAGLGVRVWFEYVRSKANVSDLPSREYLADDAPLDISLWYGPRLTGLVSTPVRPCWPELCAWDETSAEWARTFDL